MNVTKEQNKYKVESASSKGKFYMVDPDKETCNCPGYIFYAKRKGTVCKHVKAVLELLKKDESENAEEIEKQAKESESIRKEIIDFIKKNNNEFDSMDLIEKYGDKIIDDMIHDGTLIEIRGMIRYIE